MTKVQLLFIVGALASFGLGYLTCSLNYFLNSIKTSIILIRVSQVTALTALTKAIENLYFSRTYKIQKMREEGADEEAIKEFDNSFEKDYIEFKKKSINAIIDSHTGVFKQLVAFKDWHSAMNFLNKNKELAIRILKENT